MVECFPRPPGKCFFAYPLDAFEASWKYHDDDGDDESDIEKMLYAVASKTTLTLLEKIARLSNERADNER